MLGSVKDTEWSVLIMDVVTTRVMSSICRISEILDYGVSCEFCPPLPHMQCISARSEPHRGSYCPFIFTGMPKAYSTTDPRTLFTARLRNAKQFGP